MYFLPIIVFGLPKNAVGGILGRNYYLHFTDGEIEVQSALAIVQNYVVRKEKEMELKPSFSESQVQALSSLPLL